MCNGRCLECNLFDKPCISGIRKLKVVLFCESGDAEFYLGTHSLDLVPGDKFDVHIKGSFSTAFNCEVKKDD